MSHFMFAASQRTLLIIVPTRPITAPLPTEPTPAPTAAAANRPHAEFQWPTDRPPRRQPLSEAGQRADSATAGTISWADYA